jgi:ATP-dependent RNA helicase DDX24/MAK5
MTSKRGGGKRKSGDGDAASEYRSLCKMGFISLEEVDQVEAAQLLEAAGKTVTVPPVKKIRKSASFKITELQTEPVEVDLPGWKEYTKLHPSLLQGLKEAGYLKPTPIQQQVLSVVLKDAKRDVLGAAPTGSGKTLAFLLPILNEILNSSPESLEKLYALIIVPTRELALQIQQHLDIACKFAPQIHAVTLVGGLSQERQERLLGYSPNIIIGTPGRLAEIFQGHALLEEGLGTLPYLVLDEADRLAETGHFKDLDILFEMLKSRPNPNQRTFLFSATLALRTGKGKKSSVDLLRKKLVFNDKKPAILSVGVERTGSMASATSTAASPVTLQHYQLPCLIEDKDIFLCALLRSQSGRTLVFVNTIELVRDLAHLLNLLGFKCGALHAQMQQRQRLKSLERFRNTPGAVLVTSDVAARGLDIPAVDCVIHYHVPKGVDIFVHRSGRTARANQSGCSVALVAPHEQALFSRAVNATHISLKDHPLASSTTEMDRYRRAVSLAQKVTKLETRQNKEARQKSWEEKAADALGIIIDDGPKSKHRAHDDGDTQIQSRQEQQNITSMKAEIAHILSTK